MTRVKLVQWAEHDEKDTSHSLNRNLFSFLDLTALEFHKSSTQMNIKQITRESRRLEDCQVHNIHV